MDDPSARRRLVLVAGAVAVALAAVAWALPAGAAEDGEGDVRRAEAPAGGGDDIEPAVAASSEQIPVEAPARSAPGPGASISFVGPFGEVEPEWPEEMQQLMSCIADHGVAELPQSHDEVVSLWEAHRSGEHYVYRDGGVHFELSDPVVRSALDACGGSRL